MHATTVDELWKHCSEWNMPDTEVHIVYDPVYINIQDSQIHENWKQIRSCQGWEEAG